MSNNMHEGKSIKKLGAIKKRQSVNAAQGELVQESFLQPDTTLPLVLQPQIEGVDVINWASHHLEYIRERLHKYGAILFRNFTIASLDEFQRFMATISTEMVEYHEGSSPRTQLKENVYTSTDYSANETIFLHNELSYRFAFPTRIAFYCHTPALEGGETPIADVRKVYQRLDPALRERFEQKQWMLVRNYGDGFGLSWQKVYHTDDKSVVEAYCQSVGADYEWKGEDRLRTRQVRPAMTRHPFTSEPVWFNHAIFFNVTTLPPHLRDALYADFAEEDLPTNTYYGDGNLIEPEVLDAIRDAYEQEKVSFPWQKGDVLVLDNMLVAHGRKPYQGTRSILVSMSDPYEWKNL